MIDAPPLLPLHVRCLRIALQVAAAAPVLALTVRWLAGGWARTHASWAGWPHPLLLVSTALFVGLASLGGERRRPLARFTAGSSLLVCWCLFRVLTMGDAHIWREQSKNGVISHAEPLASLLHATLHHTLGPAAQEWLAPMLGFAATMAWLCITDRRIRDDAAAHPRTARAVAALLWCSSGVLTIFFQRYVEMTQLGVPLLLLGLGGLAHWARSPRDTGTGALVRGAAFVSLAAMSHLEYAAMWVAATFTLLLTTDLRERVLRRRAVGTVLLSSTVVVGLGVLATVASPFTLFTGSLTGGADGRWAVAPDQLLAATHLDLVAFLLVFAAPLTPLAAAFGGWRLLRRGGSAGAGDPVLVAAGLAWLGFASLYGFDLGWPVDVDLMVSMAPALLLATASVLLPHAGHGPVATRATLVLLGAAATVGNLAIVSPLVRPVFRDLSAVNSPAASLFVQRGDQQFGSDAGPAPFAVPAAAGDAVQLRAAGPPGRTFWIVRGAPSPACQGHPYGGIADIELGNTLRPEMFVHAGVFDANGTASVPWTVTALPDDSLPGIQMVVLDPADSDRSATSAAFYFIGR